MINIQPHLDQLEELKKQMDFYIEIMYITTFFRHSLIIEESLKSRLTLVEYIQNKLYDEVGIPADKLGKPQAK